MGTGTHMLLLDRLQVVVVVGILPHSGDRLVDMPPGASDLSCSAHELRNELVRRISVRK